MNTVDSISQDLRYGIRQLRLNPGFTLASVLSLALGIGANTAIFTLLDQIVLRGHEEYARHGDYRRLRRREV
jgi:hypothetical protein